MLHPILLFLRRWFAQNALDLVLFSAAVAVGCCLGYYIAIHTFPAIYPTFCP